MIPQWSFWFGPNPYKVSGPVSKEKKPASRSRKKFIRCGRHRKVDRTGTCKQPVFTCRACAKSVVKYANDLSRMFCPK